MTDPFTTALVAELAKKSKVCWLRYDGVDHPVWHAWVDGALCVVSGGAEQPLPGIEQQDRVEVLLRSKDSGGRLVTWTGAVHPVSVDTPEWAPVTAALVSTRHNIADLATAADDWAAASRVSRIVPTGAVAESPGSLSEASHATVPLPTGATTRGALPRVLHRRQTRRRKLS